MLLQIQMAGSEDLESTSRRSSVIADKVSTHIQRVSSKKCGIRILTFVSKYKELKSIC